jgi:hypothetical protein
MPEDSLPARFSTEFPPKLEHPTSIKRLQDKMPTLISEDLVRAVVCVKRCERDKIFSRFNSNDKDVRQCPILRQYELF